MEECTVYFPYKGSQWQGEGLIYLFLICRASTNNHTFVKVSELYDLEIPVEFFEMVIFFVVVIVVSVMYLVKYSNLAFEFKNMVLKCPSVRVHRMFNNLGKCIRETR